MCTHNPRVHESMNMGPHGPQVHESTSPRVHKSTSPRVHAHGSHGPQVHESTSPRVHESKTTGTVLKAFKRCLKRYRNVLEATRTMFLFI